MRITIEVLEALQELNDELKENRVETEKALQEDLAARDAQLREGARRIDLLEDTRTDLGHHRAVPRPRREPAEVRPSPVLIGLRC